MARRAFDPKTLLNIPLWETVQDQIARLTGTAIITVDYKGNPITKHSARTEFCSVIRENPVLRKRCLRCDALAGLEAVRLERPYIYLCHCGIADVAVPIMVGDRYLGAVMFGQVRVKQDDPEGKVRRLVNEFSSFSPEVSEETQSYINGLYRKLPEMEYSRIQEIADFLDSLVHYIVEQSLGQEQENRIEEWLHRSGEVPQESAAQDSAAAPKESEHEISMSSAVYPAVAYLDTHPGANVSMNEMAELCHLSPSYFSRLFTREVGESFVSYVNRRKIQIAKLQLRATGKSITQISGELGYINTSHFINLFKRYEGITPLLYRQNKR